MALWDEDDLPLLRKAKLGYEEEQTRGRGGVPPLEQPTTPEDGPHLLPPRHPVRSTASMAGDNPPTTVEPLPASATRLELAAPCPEVSQKLPLSESEKVKHAEGMTDTELTYHVESKLRPVGESLRSTIPYIREAHERFAHPGRRVPVPGQPTFTEWIRQNLGISARHVRRLLAEPKEPANPSCDDEMEQTPKRQKRDEMMFQAGRMAHAVLGLGEHDERDPSGLKRKAALVAMSQEFLNLAGRKHISVIRSVERASVRGFPCNIWNSRPMLRHAVGSGIRIAC